MVTGPSDTLTSLGLWVQTKSYRVTLVMLQLTFVSQNNSAGRDAALAEVCARL